MRSVISLTSTLLISGLLGLTTAQSNETVIGTFIFGRHGDRLVKPSLVLTPLGSQQVQASGEFFHDRYFDDSSEFHILGLSEVYHAEQIYASSPNSDVIQKSQVGFLQGLYPPISDLSSVSISSVPGSSLENGSSVESPLDGYQYVVRQGIPDNDPSAFWIKGDENCPTFTATSNDYFETQEFKDLNSSTLDFYQSLAPIAEGMIPKWQLNYGNAYIVYDNFLVNSIHNESFAQHVTDDMLLQIQTLQDVYTKNLNYNPDNSSSTIGGQSLNGAILKYLNQTKVTSSPLITYFTGSYDTFNQVFGLLGLYDVDERFNGLVNYAASIVFELVQTPSEQGNGNDTFVRFLIRNGSLPTDKLTSYPILGESSTLIPYDTFVNKMQNVSISSLGEWCTACDGMSTAVCASVARTADSASSSASPSATASASAVEKDQGGLSLAGAGGIGAGVTLGVVGIAAIVAFLFYRRTRTKSASAETPVLPVTEKVAQVPSLASSDTS